MKLLTAQFSTDSCYFLLLDPNILLSTMLSNISAIHILCEAMAYLKFHHLDQFFMEPIDYYDVPINKVLHFIQSVGLIKS
jgi:hypothetical protein